MKITGFNHFQLDSGDVEKTRAFYEALGGTTVQVMERKDGWKGYHVRLTHNTVIEIQPPRIPEECGGSDGWDHLALYVTDIEEMCRKVAAAGGRIEKKPTPNQVGDMKIINAVTYGIDGEKIELIQKVEAENDPNSGLILETAHMQLNSMDVVQSRTFYEQAFGGKTIVNIMDKQDVNKLKGFMVEIVDGSVIEIQPPRFGKSGKKSAWNTIAIETDDIEAACRQIEAAGGIREVGPMEGQMGTIAIRNAIIIGPSDEHIELIELI